MPQKNIKMDTDTEGMLEDLVDLDRAEYGETSNAKVVRDLVRAEHRIKFPDQWSGPYFKNYSKTA